MQRLTRAQAASARTSCTVCHRRKVRCDAHDAGFPCSNCRTTSRGEDCRLYEKQKRSFRREKIAQVSTGERLISQKLAENAPLDGARVVGFPLDASAGDGEYLYKRHLVEFVEQQHISERPIDSNSRTVYIGTEVANVHFLAEQHFGDRISRVWHYPTDRLARRETCHEPDQLPVEAFELPPSAVVDKLLDAYFTHVNPGFPVIDQTLFLQQYSARDPQNPPSLLLLHAILVVGAHVLYDDAPARETTKATFFRRAKSLFDARFERNRDVIVQAALLLSWHADGPEDVAANAWFWVGVAVRTAVGLGMHRDADESTIIPHNKRMWRRVWWLLFQCDTLLSLQYGRPQSIRLDECDVKKLQVSDFQDCGPNSRPTYVIHTTDMCVIMSHGLRERFRLPSTPESRQHALHRLDKSLSNWSLQLPNCLHMNVKDDSSLDVWPAYLQLHYNMMLLLLHRSPPHRIPAREDAEICSLAAGSIQSISQRICDDDKLRCLWISSVNCMFAALIQLSVEVRTSNPLVVLPSILRYDATLSSFKKLVQYWPNSQGVLHFFENKKATRQTEGVEAAKAGEGIIDNDRSSPSQTSLEAPGTQLPDTGTSNAAQSHLHTSGIDIVPDFARVAETVGSWHEWRDSQWQQEEMTNNFLFNF